MRFAYVALGFFPIAVASVLLVNRRSEEKQRWLPQTPVEASVYAAKLFLIVWLASSLIYGLNAALWFAGNAADGPFLVFNGLRRIAAGQVAGRDFVDIHGIGLPYLHYPLFAVFGANGISASELSRQWTSVVLFFLSLWAFTRAAFGKSYLVWPGLALSIMFMETALPLDAVGTPGNLDSWVRSTMPVFAFAILLLPLHDWLKALLTGLCIALAFLFGTEHGIGLTVGLFAFLAFSVIQSFQRRAIRACFLDNLRFSAMCLGSAAVLAGAALIVLCGVSGALNVLHFNLVEMPIDQIWFFGGPPMPHVGVWKDLLHRHSILIFLPTYIALGILSAMVIKFWRRPLRIGRDWQVVAIWMLLYGIVSGVPLLAILSRHYVFPLLRVLTLILLLLCTRSGLPRLVARPPIPRVRRLSTIGGGLLMAVCAVWSFILVGSSMSRVSALVDRLHSEHSYSKLLDDNWNDFMTGATHLIDSKRERKSVSIWSAYAGLLESHYGVFHPAQDYIIHASYGPQRWSHYLESFRRANTEFVTSMTPDFDFEEWLQNERWEFYEAVLNNYRPLQRVQHAIIWQRRPGLWRAPSQDFHSIAREQEKESYLLPANGTDQLAIIRVRYIISNRWAWIPLIGRTPRYLATIEGSPRQLVVSFPPYRSEFDFPVQVPAGHAVRIRFTTQSLLPGVQFRIGDVQQKILHCDPSEAAIFFASPHKYRT